jgi:hypothetical protein
MATIGRKVVSISELVYFKGTPIKATARKLSTAFKANKPLFCHFLSIKKDKTENDKASKK